jgi:hypothetical protein
VIIPARTLTILAGIMVGGALGGLALFMGFSGNTEAPDVTRETSDDSSQLQGAASSLVDGGPQAPARLQAPLVDTRQLDASAMAVASAAFELALEVPQGAIAPAVLARRLEAAGFSLQSAGSTAGGNETGLIVLDVWEGLGGSRIWVQSQYESDALARSDSDPVVTNLVLSVPQGVSDDVESALTKMVSGSGGGRWTCSNGAVERTVCDLAGTAFAFHWGASSPEEDGAEGEAMPWTLAYEVSPE